MFVMVLAGPAGSQQMPAPTGAPATLPGTPIPPPPAPSMIAWTVTLPAAPAVSPIIAGDTVVVSYLPGIVAGLSREDGRELWRVDLTPEQPLVADGSTVFVAAGEALHAIRLSDGSTAWHSPSGTLTAPPVVKEGWLLAATKGKLTARRAADGSEVWTVDSGVQREPAAISGDVLFISLAGGSLVARDLPTGRIRWERRLAGDPAEPLVFGDDVFVGASDKAFYCVDAKSGEVEWPMRIGATIRGRAAADNERVYFVALDNLVRAVDRTDGAVRWHTPVPFRPVVGPIVAGGSVFIAGSSGELRILLGSSGASAGAVTFPDRLALAPGALETKDGIVFAAVTGSLQESWKVSLTLPMATVPAPR
jgi:outer membrane protein assembly factor BamB